jgi:hypothetical protein
MNLLNQNRKFSLEEFQSSMKSLFQQTIYVFMGLTTMLLVTGGNPSSQVLTMSFIVGTLLVAWVEQKRISKQRKITELFYPAYHGNRKISTIKRMQQALELSENVNPDQFLTVDNHVSNHLTNFYVYKSKDVSIKIIGDRASGKTTYLAALAYQTKLESSNLIQEITFTNKESLILLDKAWNILEQGMELEPTHFYPDSHEIPSYSLQLILKGEKSLGGIFTGSRKKIINLNIKEYAGEFLKNILYEDNSPFIRNYIEDTSKANGIIFVLDGSHDSTDSKRLDALLNSIKNSEFVRSKRLRIAVTVAKCELPSVSIMSKNPRQLMQKNFWNIYETLENHCKSGLFEVEYFSTSSFGMLDNSLDPNSTPSDGSSWSSEFFTIKNPSQWRPVGILAPIYWLITGQYSQEN